MHRTAPTLLACALLLAAGLPAQAGPAEDYIAARNKAVAAVDAAVQGGKSDAQIAKIEDTGRKDLQKRMTAMLGPLKFKGLNQKPIFSPETLVRDELGSDSPDGMVFMDEEGATYILVSPEPVFADWLAARAKDEGAPAAFKDGIKAATGDEFFYTLTVSRDAAFSNYAELAPAANPGETVHAALGLFSQDIAGNAPPDTVVVTRIADGRVSVASADAAVKVPEMPACDAAWKAASAKADALLEEVQKSGKEDDPRWEEGFRAQDDASHAYRLCFMKEAAGKPFLAEAGKRAEAMLDVMRGK
ncbi:hypothetical protein [Xanthobacter tagetidis]|uniref:DUF2066 domain-containing protein n=1 Tax=Xanthobacter tagetidis TaxID=60216 RepID=A0A3L7A5L3_9HYPH|nr:hypothetical protein [Xanthobacter tagetidis]MBB6308677.1 hypothetical protein [Xanthobacter tagetidis]RLP75394.1 hypothetical protein D9R14_16625 [Xanthobacter tagetidis]